MKKKVLLMGKSGAGKTSMRSIIFANYIAIDTRRLGATNDVEHSHVRFLGNLMLNIWDCGGQEAFLENFIASQREIIFRSVEVLIYVFDVECRDEDLKKDIKYFQTCLSAVSENSPNAKVFCLVHKMDLIQEDQKEKFFIERENEIINATKPMTCICFKTSIWDETLYKAWSSIVSSMIPNVKEFEQGLKKIGDVMEADEVLLFERATFLVISNYQRVEHHDVHRFEKVSNIIKQFKLGCSKVAAQFNSIVVKKSDFAAFIELFTSNTYIMIVVSDPSITSALVSMNLKSARKHFEKLEQKYQASQSSMGGIIIKKP